MDAETGALGKGLGFASIAILTVLMRDLVGYLLSGILFLIGLEVYFGIVSEVAKQISAFPELVSSTIFLAVSYPTGRLVYFVGSLLFVKGPFSANAIWNRVMSDLESAGVDLKRIRPFGLRVCQDQAELFRRVTDALTLELQPDFYFMSVSRSNTLRLLAETNVGLAGLLAILALFSTLPNRFLVAGCLALVTILVLFLAIRLRKINAKDILMGIYFSSLKLEEAGQNQPVPSPGTNP